MGARQIKPQPPQLVTPSKVGVYENREANGFHLVELNLDANSDGSGVSPWSIVFIVVATLICVWFLIRLKKCLQHKFRQHHNSMEVGPLRFEKRSAIANVKDPEVVIIDENPGTKHVIVDETSAPKQPKNNRNNRRT